MADGIGGSASSFPILECLSVDRAVLTGFIVDGGSEAPFFKLSPSTGQGGAGGGGGTLPFGGGGGAGQGIAPYGGGGDSIGSDDAP